MSANIRDEFVSASVPVEEVASTGVSFVLAYVVKKAGAVAVKTFTSAAGVNADADLTSGQKAKIATAFGQSLRPSYVYVITANTSASQDYDDALTAAKAAGLSWYYTGCESRVAADIKTVSDWVQTNGGLYLAQSADNDWIDTAGGPAAFASGGASDISTNFRTMVVYHPTDAQGADVAILAAASAVDVDVRAPAFNAQVSGVTAYTLTTSEAANAYGANCIYLIPPTQGASTRYPAPRSILTYTGETPSAYVAADWFADRWSTDVVNDYLAFAATDSKYPWSRDGIALAVGKAVSRAQQGIRAGHFTTSTTYPDGYTFTGSLVSNFGIALTGAIQYLDAARSVSLVAPLTRGA